MLLTGRVLTGTDEIADGAVEVAQGRIARVGPRVGPRTGLPPGGHGTPPGWRDGLVILPGLVDVHCHGGGGGEFGTDLAAARAAIDRHRRQGTTSLVASLVSAPVDRLVEGVRLGADLTAAGELAGLHLEGPFLSGTRCGAQDPATLTDPDPAVLDRLQAAAAQAGAPQAIAHQTFAPERSGAAGLPAALARYATLAAVGHTDADSRTVRQALATAAEVAPRGGRPLVTHLFNGMPALHHRSPGPVAAALAAAARGEAVLELIADGVHLHPDTVAMVFDTVGPGAICLVSDAMAASGMPDGGYTLGGRPVRVSSGAARLAGPGSPPGGGPLAGGVACLLDLVRGCVRDAGVPLADAVAAATSTPAVTLGLAGVGRIATGCHADLVVLDQDLALVAVLRHGAWVTPPAAARA